MKCIGLCLLGLLHCSTVWSLESDRTLQQINHRSFAVTGGAPSEVLALAQATDGTLWVGGQTGLSRFDGLQATSKLPGALRAGASGYLLKNLVRKELIDTIRAVHPGKRRVPPEIAIEIAEHVADDALTEREIEVLRRVAAGKSNKVIAAELHISEGTGKTHMKSILPKLDASDRTHAVMIALKRGILDV